jgi:integrase
MSAQDALTEEQLDAFLAAVSRRGPTGRRNLALFTLMADSGLRVGEALALTTGNLEREGGVVTRVRVRMGKGGKPATVPVTSRCAGRLERWLAERGAAGLGPGPLFCTISRGQATGYSRDGELAPGRALDARYVRQAVARVAARAGIAQRVTPHTLRHTFATHLLRQTGNLDLTRKALRHARITTTATVYAHLAERDVEAAVRGLRAPEEPARPERGDVPDALAAVLATLTAEQRRALAAALLGGAASAG